MTRIRSVIIFFCFALSLLLIKLSLLIVSYQLNDNSLLLHIHSICVRQLRMSIEYSVSDKLVEIPPNEWKTLRDLFLPKWPNDISGYFTVDNYIRWYQHDPNIKNLKFFSLNGDWKDDGTFVVIVSVLGERPL